MSAESGARAGRNDQCPCGSGGHRRKYKQCCGRPREAGAPPVLYVHPSKQGVTLTTDRQTMGRPYGLLPMGIVGLANMLRGQGIEVQGVNLPLEYRLDRAFDLRAWLRARSQARVVLIDLHWYEHSFGAIDVARICRQALPDRWIVLGGLTASAYAAEILSAHPAVDLIIRGDAERPLSTLVPLLLQAERRQDPSGLLRQVPNLTYRQGESAAQSALGYTATQEELDALDFCSTSFLEHAFEYRRQQYVLPGTVEEMDTSGLGGHWLCIARGCLYECAFCGGCRSAHRALAGRQGLVCRSPERVAEDLRCLAEAGVVQVALSHDLASLGRDYWLALFERLSEMGVRIGLYNEFFQLPDRAFIEVYAQYTQLAHSCVALSPLSGNERVRRLNGKAFTNVEFFAALEALRACGVPLIVYFSLNLPGEDQSTFEETLSLARRVQDYYPSHMLKILNSLHTLDPLSPMALRPERFNIRVNASSFAAYYHYCAMTALAHPEARIGVHRGYVAAEPPALASMAARWEELRRGREANILPIPESW
ncbi:MAG: radical SAM protein [Chloroflexi bacterium]|nr:radical SAM protein [Chloroflexota bacterium]